MIQTEAANKLQDVINQALDSGLHPVEMVGLLDLFKATINQSLMEIADGTASTRHFDA